MKFKFCLKKSFVLMAFILVSLSLAVIVVNAQIGARTYSTDLSRSYQSIGAVSTQYYSPSFSSTAGYISPSVYWPEFDQETCRERRDFIVQVAPGGCKPAVVRSDLLEEQPVPVFCKLMLVQTNPLVDVSRIRSISFQGKYPEGVYDVGYFPSRYAIARNRRNLADTPIDDNMGYFVVVLGKQPVEDKMPDWIEGNLSAVIYYDLENALGIGRTSFYVSEMDYEDWLRDYKKYSFWNDKGYIRVESIEPDRATISIYKDMDTKHTTLTLRKGETSGVIYLPGFYCAAGLKVNLEDIDVPVESALLQVDDQQVWVATGDRVLDGKCSVRQVDAYAGGGKVSISCPVQNGNFDLKLDPGKISLKISEDGSQVDGVEAQDYSIGSKVKDNVYLAYVGVWQEGEEEKKFVVFVSDPYSDSETEFRDKEVYTIVERVIWDRRNSNKGLSELEEEIQRAVVTEYSRKIKNSQMEEEWIKISQYEDGGENEQIEIKGHEIESSAANGEKSYFIQLAGVDVGENRDWETGSEKEKLAKEYYDESVQNYKDLVDFYPSEKKINDDYFETYAAEGLYEAAVLANEFDMFEDRNEFLSKLRLGYPDSAYTEKAESDIKRLLRYDSSEGKAVVNLRDGSYIVELLDFKRVKKEDASVDLVVNGKDERLGLEEVHYVDENDVDKGTLRIIKIDNEYVDIEHKRPEGNSYRTRTARLDLDRNKQTDFDRTDITVVLQNINLKKQVKLTLDSEVRGPRALANFSFKIGIEKRGIKLSPEKTTEMIQNLEESMEEWKSINEKLGKVVKGLKGACFATSAILTVKNLFEGFAGKSMARNDVMTRVGGWNDFCEKEVSDGKSVSVQACLLEHNSDIEKDVEVAAGILGQTNKELEQAREGLIEREFLDFEGQVTDRKKLEEKYKEMVKGDCEAASIAFGLSSEYVDFCKEGDLDDIRDLVTLYRTKEAGGLSEVSIDAIQSEAERKARGVQTNFEWRQAREAAEKEVTNLGLGVKSTNLGGDNIHLAYIKELTDSDKSGVYKDFPDLGKGESVMRVFIPKAESFGGEIKEFNSAVAGSFAIVKLEKDERGIYTFEKAYTTKGDTNDAIVKDVKDYLGLKNANQFRKSNAKAYENKMENVDDLRVKYFERAPYKGLPAEVPFDVNNGWYVEMEYVLSGFGKPYDESGRVANFYICNVGPNGFIEFKRKADDICRYYNGVSSDVEFPGMTLTESRKIVARARNAVSEAIRYYEKEEAVIEGQVFKTGISFGGEVGRCSDFMSPQDCHLMFNLCDPVICPASRCDLGGAFPVDNVIQTGIIGSLTLCLPNIKEKIYVPICLSGVHAGIEGYLSILEAHRDCLNESLETGRHVGVCDEIYSIYLCEFFWRQIVPFADVLLPKLIESFFSQGVRGGGEYLTVQSAWENTQSSIDYFKNEYAVNSMQAFEMRSTEEAGTEVCKSFISARYPTDFDLLTEPDSPVQYHAWFDENVLSTATPYPTSHYKVYYHIYSGKDQGAYYYVYLKDISEEYVSYYINKPGRYVVDTGYLGKGEYVDEARDFTAPSGYKQLCININGQDECDFGKVSTSFAVNYLSDQYAKEQAEQEITRSEDCVAGTPSLWSMAQPNLQAGAEEFTQPELYNQGIVRVCSTYNPGKQVDAKGEYDTTNRTFDRWKDVGYCDDKTLRCWLDTESVRDVIKNKELEEGVLQEVDTSIIGKGYLTYEESRAIAGEVESLFEKGGDKKLGVTGKETTKGEVEKKIKYYVDKLNRVIALAPSNSHRARGLLLLGRLYKKVARLIRYDGRLPGSGELNTGGEEGVGVGETAVVQTDLQKAEEENPENFVYMIYSDDKKLYMYYNYDVGEWKRVFSKQELDLSGGKWSGLGWSADHDFLDGQDWLSASDGLDKIKEIAGNYDSEVIYIPK